MTLALFISSLINGFASGAIYMLIATGFTIMFGIGKILNFAHGEVYMAAGLILWTLNISLGLHYFAAAILTIAIMGLIGFIVNRTLFRFVREDSVRTCMLSIGLLLMIQNIGSILFPKAKGIPSVVHGVVSIGPTSLSAEKIVVIALSVSLMFGLYFFIQKTNAGRSMRALGQDPEAANIVGVKIELVIHLTYVVSFCLAGAAAVLMAPLTAASAFSGPRALMKALIVVIVGGIGSISGAVLGGLLLGLVESFAQTFLGSLTEPAAFGVVILTLVFRPRGLLGREEVQL